MKVRNDLQELCNWQIKRNFLAQLIAHISHTFRSLKHRDFRLYFFGQIISLTGTWMQLVALSWLVYRMTNSAVWLGIIECANLLPMLIFGLSAGWLADHFDRRRTIIITQIFAMLQAILLTYLTLTNQIQVWQCVVLSAFFGTVTAWETPSRQAFLIDIIEREDLVNAISLNSSLFNGARFIGPAVAGLLVAKFGEGLCFAINSLSFIAILAALFAMKIEHKSRVIENAEVKTTLKDAFLFVRNHKEIRPVLLLSLIITVFGLQYTVLLPVMAKEVLHGGVETLGMLRAFGGLGALIAALALASRAHGEFLKKAVGLAAFSLGLGLLAFGLSKNLFFSELLCVLTGFFMTTLLSGSHSLVQLNVSDHLRGRVMSIYMTIMLGLNPIGSFIVGCAANRFGAPSTIIVCAIVSALAGLTYLLFLRRTNRLHAP